MISAEDANEMVGELTNALSVSRSARGRASIARALQIATAVSADLNNPPNVIVRTAEATFEMTDLVPMLPVAEAPPEP